MYSTETYSIFAECLTFENDNSFDHLLNCARAALKKKKDNKKEI